MFASNERRWWIVIAAVLGLAVGSGTINVFGFAAFLKPVSSELGISRATLAAGLLLTSVSAGIGAPFVGFLADRYGSRIVLLVGIPLYALSISALGLLQPSISRICLLFVMAGAFGALQNTVPYARVISKWFDRDRGLALGIAMAGIGLGIAVVPQVATVLIKTEGWRLAYGGMGLMVMLFAFVPAAAFIRDPADGEAVHAYGKAGLVPGLTAAQAFASWRFWILGIVFFGAVNATNGTLVHVVAMLTDRGMGLEQATTALSAAGLAVIVGRVACGWFLDRVHGPYVAAGFFLLTAIGIGLLNSNSSLLCLFGTTLCGAGLGAHSGLLAFFTSRYFGLKAYGSIYGALFGIFLIGSGTGPFLGGLSFEMFNSYEPVLVAFGSSLLVISVCLLPLGPYPYAMREPASSDANLDLTAEITPAAQT